MRVVEAVLDGMPEPPPRWERPDSSARLPAVVLDQLLADALPHTMSSADAVEVGMPFLAAVEVTVANGLLQVVATDRYTLLREREPINQECEDFTVVVRRDDVLALRALLKALLRGLDKDQRLDEPVDLFVERPPGGRPTLAVVGDDLDVRFVGVAGDGTGDGLSTFPDHERLIDTQLDTLDRDGDAPMDMLLNPQYVARLVPCCRAGRMLRFRWAGRRRTVVVRPWGEDDDDLVVLIVPVVPTDDGVQP